MGEGRKGLEEERGEGGLPLRGLVTVHVISGSIRGINKNLWGMEQKATAKPADRQKRATILGASRVKQSESLQCEFP